MTKQVEQAVLDVQHVGVVGVENTVVDLGTNLHIQINYHNSIPVLKIQE